MKQHVISFKEFLKEEYLGVFTGTDWEMYKNPKSVKRMTGNGRAVSDKNGDLFYIDIPSGDGILHATLVELLQRKEIIEQFKVTYISMKKKFILWEQDGKTNDFYLSSSYTDSENINADFIVKLTQKVEQKNRSLNFLKQNKK